AACGGLTLVQSTSDVVFTEFPRWVGPVRRLLNNLGRRCGPDPCPRPNLMFGDTCCLVDSGSLQTHHPKSSRLTILSYAPVCFLIISSETDPGTSPYESKVMV